MDYDTTIALSDAQIIQKYALKTVVPSVLQKYLADYNNDGQVTQEDAQMVIKKALKLN